MASPRGMYLSTDRIGRAAAAGVSERAHISNCHICYDFLAFGVGVGFGNKGGSKATLTSVGDAIIDGVGGQADAEEFRRWERENMHICMMRLFYGVGIAETSTASKSKTMHIIRSGNGGNVG